MVALCVGPLAAWIIYARRVLDWPKFVLAVVAAYSLPSVVLTILALVTQQFEFEWLNSMMKF